MSKTNSADRTPVDAIVIRLPQRFQWKDSHDQPWRNGIVFPNEREELGIWWSIRAGVGHGSFDDDPWEMMGHIIGDAAAFRWIDNDYDWEPLGAICCDTTYDDADDFRNHLKIAHSGG